MVYVKTDWGGFHEPPYTEAEILEVARRANGGVLNFSSHQHRSSVDTQKAIKRKKVTGQT